MMNIHKNGQKHEDYLRRQRLKRKSSAFIFCGFIICSHLTITEGFHGLPYWLGASIGLALLFYGVITYLPIQREEKKETEEWKKKEQAEIEAANAYLFGTTQNRS